MTEDEMVGWHYQLDGHKFEKALGVGDGQGSPVCCSPWGRKESDRTEQQNWTEHKIPVGYLNVIDKLKIDSKNYGKIKGPWNVQQKVSGLI